jgi:hypothetical protein
VIVTVKVASSAATKIPALFVISLPNGSKGGALSRRG